MTDDRIPPEFRGTAKRLRQEMTAAERRVWVHLKAHRLHGLGFRRQVPMGRYVVDFVCHQRRLIVEIDGSQHGTEEGMLKDEERTRFLESQGYRVLRVWNSEVFESIDGVLHRIGAAAGILDPERVDTPLPTLPHKGGGRPEF